MLYHNIGRMCLKYTLLVVCRHHITKACLRKPCLQKSHLDKKISAILYLNIVHVKNFELQKLGIYFPFSK